MALDWWTSYIAELRTPKGWSLAAKGMGGLLTVAATGIALLSFWSAQRTDQINALAARINGIQANLLSGNSTARVVGLRALQSLDSDAQASLIGDGEARVRVLQFVRASLIDGFEGVNLPAMRGGAKATGETQEAASELERYQLLLTLDNIGGLEWDKSAKSRPANVSADYSWLPTAQDESGASSVSNVFDGFQFPRRQIVRFRFSCASLAAASFRGGDVKGSQFQYSGLSNSDFSGALLEYDSFVGANLRGARFDAAQLEGDVFSAPRMQPESNLDTCWRRTKGAVTPEATQLVAASFVGAKLVDTELLAVAANGASFRKAILSSVKFYNAGLDGAGFDEATLSGVSFEDAALSGASFDRATLTGTRFRGSDLHNAHFIGARFLDTGVADSMLQGANLRGANFGGAQGLSPEQACRISKAGAVFVTDEKGWQEADRQVSDAARFQSAADQLALSGCQR
ncbi:pentapeptide repeat-containing protein [Phenylobacterium sp.]|uniref:pentapeptide repeat-containing protein n=1 Tax=Phenylobacterium sp. TaxID=1871053 RepID=UPI002C996F09|nr:pentapeptide repeat-containing protein [Phenylobacterium sp.]HLZ77135.1 pentapeptide repeat-containing protein [Phenylobacterium sp.]